MFAVFVPESIPVRQVNRHGAAVCSCQGRQELPDRIPDGDGKVSEHGTFAAFPDGTHIVVQAPSLPGQWFPAQFAQRERVKLPTRDVSPGCACAARRSVR